MVIPYWDPVLMVLEADLLKRTMNDAWIIDSAAMMGKDAEA